MIARLAKITSIMTVGGWLVFVSASPSVGGILFAQPTATVPCKNGCSYTVDEKSWVRTSRGRSESRSTFGHDVMDTDIVFHLADGQTLPKYLHIRGYSNPPDVELQYGMTKVLSFSFSDTVSPDIQLAHPVYAEDWGSTGNAVGTVTYKGTRYQVKIIRGEAPALAIVWFGPA